MLDEFCKLFGHLVHHPGKWKILPVGENFGKIVPEIKKLEAGGGRGETIVPPALFSVQHDLRRAMACEITAVNDDLDDATIAFIEKHASILDEEDPFLCFIDELDDHRAIFRSMDQLSRLSFTSTMIPEFGKLFGYLVASEKRIPSTKLLQRISLSILRSAGGDQSLCCQINCAIDSIHLWCHHFQFGVFQQARYCIASIDGDPRSRPTCGFGEPVHCFAAIRPVSKVTEHCQTASRKSDRTLHRPLSCPASAWRWYESATSAIP
ncbi:hypothetical protein PAPYR_9285 [Paratrimastix pyriformis]|uniref:Uncharacterized protein n=1 Tax=Paratrimastix pyriformis TaxID=342808 RepID=A0ABQ8UCV1_9EUKA|nr:hypothetical protein PAPYR_9285 [Paratrimastix pyriformis]